MTTTERLERLLGACPWGIFVVDINKIGDDVMRHFKKPGAIILAESTDAVRFIPTGDNPMLSCVAGWISDDDEGASA